MVEDDAEQPATEKATTIAAAIRKLIFDRPLHADNKRQQRGAEHMFYNETDARLRILFPDPERATAGSVPTNLKKIHHHSASARELFTRTMMHKAMDVIDMPAPSQRAEDTHNKAIIDLRFRLSFFAYQRRTGTQPLF